MIRLLNPASQVSVASLSKTALILQRKGRGLVWWVLGEFLMRLSCRLMLSTFVVTAAFAAPASAKPAQCFTTDDGYYSCDFRGLDKAGSFRTSARGYPTYVLEVYQSGRAYGYADFGTGSKPLPGEYIRSRQDRACWDNTVTGTQICAW